MFITLCLAIDAAGCSHGADEQYEPSVVAAFLEARELGLHRTVHAGESSGAQSIVRGVEEMGTEVGPLIITFLLF